MDAAIIRGLRRTARWLLIGTAGAAGAVLAASSPASAATTATFTNGVLTVFGDSGANTITISRDAAGTILVNNGADSRLRRHADGRQHRRSSRCSAGPATT